MKPTLLIAASLMFAATAAFGSRPVSLDPFQPDGPQVTVRYANHFRGDDHAVVTCLIFSDDTGMLIGTGLTSLPKPVAFTLSRAQQEHLQTQLGALQLGAGAAQSEKGVLLPRNMPDLAVTSDRVASHWEKVALTSSLGKLVKSICDIDVADRE